jgi:hypothetical protein
MSGNWGHVFWLCINIQIQVPENVQEAYCHVVDVRSEVIAHPSEFTANMPRLYSVTVVDSCAMFLTELSGT